MGMASDGAAADATTEPSSEVRSTAKWLVTIGTGVAAVIAAGLSLNDLRGLGYAPADRLLIAGVSLVVGLAAIAWIVGSAVRVLLVQRQSLYQLAQADRDDSEKPSDRDDSEEQPPRVESTQDPLVAQVPTRLEDSNVPLVKHLLETRRDLLGGRDSLVALHDDLVAAQNAQLRGGSVVIRGVRYSDKFAGTRPLSEMVSDLERRSDVVERAAENFQLHARFKHLATAMIVGSVAFLVAMAVFTIATAQQAALVDAPIAVEVRLPTDGRVLANAGLDEACAGRTVKGVAVGGTLLMPVVVTTEHKDVDAEDRDPDAAQADCPAGRFTAGPEFIVVPELG